MSPMKRLHRDNLFAWSQFDEARNLDFHSVLWLRNDGNVIVDPLPLSDHDQQHVDALGGVDTIIVTNSDHLRAAPELKQRYGAELCGPSAERSHLAAPCDRWLEDGEEVVPGLRVRELAGSKTPGELCVLLEPHTLIFGDLVRGHLGGRLNLLPEPKLADPEAARSSVRQLTEAVAVEAVLVGDGWHIFRDGQRALEDLVQTF